MVLPLGSSSSPPYFLPYNLKKKERNDILILVPSLPSQKNENLSFPI